MVHVIESHLGFAFLNDFFFSLCFAKFGNFELFEEIKKKITNRLFVNIEDRGYLQCRYVFIIIF